MRTLILALVLLFFGQSVFCQDWIYVGTDKDGGKWYLKSSYVKKGDLSALEDGVKIWTKKESGKTTIKKGNKTFTYTNVKELQLIVADCTDKKIKIITSSVYNSQGKTIDSWTLKEYEQEWVDVVPESVGEMLLNKICNLFN